MRKAIAMIMSAMSTFAGTVLLHSEIIDREGREGNGRLEQQQAQRVLHVKGTPYEMGFQHGKLLKELVAKNVSDFIDAENPALQSRVASFKHSLPQLIAHIPTRFQEEMRGVADGSGVPLQKIIALNTFPEMFHCTGLTVSDQATKEGALYHVRVLDYSIGKSLQNTAVLMVVEPEEGHSFVNVSYAGFIGSVTGMNDQQIAMGEIGGWGYGHWNGMPMPFLFREVLEKASSLEDAKRILSDAARTCEYYYVISDGKNNSSVGVYATENQIHFFEPGTAYTLLAPKDFPAHYDAYADKLCLSSGAVMSTSHQTLLSDAQGQGLMVYHQQPHSCVVMTGFTHPERYPLLVERILAAYGTLDEKQLQEIIKCPVARDSNLHNAIFLPAQLKLWVAHAGPNDEPACAQPYAVFEFSKLLGHKSSL